MQKSTALLIRRAPFSRLVREIAQGNKPEPHFRMQSIALAALQEAAETMIVMWFEMLYSLLVDKFSLKSQLAAFHGRRVTVMKKDAVLVARIINLWDSGSFLSKFASAASTGPDYEQQMPRKKYRRSKARQRPEGAPEPHYKEKARSKRPNSASNMTGGKGPDVRDKLAAKAARK
jgi:histone H3/H4